MLNEKNPPSRILGGEKETGGTRKTDSRISNAQEKQELLLKNKKESGSQPINLMPGFSGKLLFRGENFSRRISPVKLLTSPLHKIAQVFLKPILIKLKSPTKV